MTEAERREECRQDGLRCGRELRQIDGAGKSLHAVKCNYTRFYEKSFWSRSTGKPFFKEADGWFKAGFIEGYFE